MKFLKLIRTATNLKKYSATALTMALIMSTTLMIRAQLPVTEGLIVWLKADAVDINNSSQVRISGSNIYVKQWNDQSTNEMHATNGIDGDQPLYIATGLNGQPVLRFAQDSDDNGDRLYLGDLSARFPNAGSIFTVATIDNDGRYNVFGNRNNDERWMASNWNESRPGSFRAARSTDATFTFNDWPQTGAHVFSLESSSSAFRVLIDGSEIGSDAGDYHSGSGVNWTIANRSTSGQQLQGDIPELILYDRILTSTETDQVGGYLASKYGLTGTAYPAMTPETPANLTAKVTTGPVDLNWTAAVYAAAYNIKRSAASGGPYSIIGTTSITNYSDISGSAGITNYYVVTATNTVSESGISNEAAAAREELSDKDILTFSFGTLGSAIIIGTNIVKDVPLNTDVTTLTPTYTISALASEDSSYPSGSTRDFTLPKTYTITAENGTTKAYLITVLKSERTTYDFTSGLQSWKQIWPSARNGELWENEALGSGNDYATTRFGRSPEFHLNSLGDLTFELLGGQSHLSWPAFTPDSIPEQAMENGFAGVALREVATGTYVLSKNRDGNNGDTWLEHSFSLAELTPYINNNKKYTLDYIDYNWGGWGWTYLDNVSIPGTLTPTITSFTLEPFDSASIVGTNITIKVAHYVNTAALAPTYTVAPLSTISTPLSGTTQDFSSGPVKYTVISLNLLNTNVYMVTVETMPDPTNFLVGQWVAFCENLLDTSDYSPSGTHDGIAVGPNASQIAFSSDVPSGFSGSSLDLSAGNAGVKIKNSATGEPNYANTYDNTISNKCTITFWAKGTPSEWSPWVAKRGESAIGWQLRRFFSNNYACFTIRGIDNEDGGGSNININDNPSIWHHFAGVWDQTAGTRKLYIDGVLSHVNYNQSGQTMNLATGHALTLGTRTNNDGTDFESYFSGLLFDIRIYKQTLLPYEINTVMTTSIPLKSTSTIILVH